MIFEDLNIERQIVRDEINNLKLIINRLNPADLMSDLHRIEELQIILEEKIKYEKTLY
jgi:hypothetical protein